ncbi:MAG: thermonuclease family protein, partial [Acidobacteriota bacterium]
GKCEGDVFDRPLRYVRLADGRDFGLVMIQEGFCADYGWKYTHPRGAEYAKAQEAPKKAKKGMWQEDRWDR